VLASAEQIDAFKTAAQHVFDEIEKNPFNRELIASMIELKSKTTPAPGAETCTP
jgi:hypothetical protein